MSESLRYKYRLNSYFVFHPLVERMSGNNDRRRNLSYGGLSDFQLSESSKIISCMKEGAVCRNHYVAPFEYKTSGSGRCYI